MILKQLFKINLLILFITTGITSRSQSYIPTVQEGRTWELFWNKGMGSFGYLNYQITCDTTINNYIYKKVYYLNNSQLPTWYIGSVREDINNQKVYFYHKDSTNETLVVDYNLPVGSVFYFGHGLYEDVDSIRTENIFFQNRKVLYFSSVINWIEGVGHRFYGIITDENYKLVSRINDNPYNCSLLTIEENSSTQIEIYPNPANEYLRIKELPNGINSVPYEIFSTSGKKLQEGNIESEKEISILTINENIIILKLIFNESPTYKKIILIK